MNKMANRHEIKKLHITSDRDDITVEEYHNIIETTILKDYINQCVIDSIEYAIKKNRKSAKLLEIGTSGTVLQLEKSKWRPALESIITQYVKNEQYEECIKLNKLLNSID